MKILEEIIELTKLLENKNNELSILHYKNVALVEETKEQAKTIDKMKWDHRNAIDKLNEDKSKALVKITGDITPEQRAVMIETLSNSNKVSDSQIKSYYKDEIKNGKMSVYEWDRKVFANKDKGKIYEYYKGNKFERYELLYNLILPTPEVSPLGSVKEVFPDEYAKTLKEKK